VNIKIAGKWMFIPLKMVSIGIDPYPFQAIPNSYWNGLDSFTGNKLYRSFAIVNVIGGYE
jgi:hypothetical protein